MPQNCYAYATKYSIPQTALDPGDLAKKKYKDTSIRELQRAAQADGLILLSDQAARLPDDFGSYAFIVAGLSSSSQTIAYHWIRRDSTGEWSHKFGDGSILQMEPSDKDAAGNKLSDSNHAGIADFDFGKNFKQLLVSKLSIENDQSGWVTNYDQFVGWFGCTETCGILFCDRKTDKRKGCTIL